jgi:N utilization substance protein A
MEVTLDADTLALISFFENVTRARVKDCFAVEGEERVVFVVEEGTLRNAIGKNGENIKRFKERIKKVVDVIEYSPKPEKFVKNIFHNFKVTEVKIEQGSSGKTAYVKVDPKDKGRAIGKEGRNLKLARKIVARHHSEIANILIL